MLLKGMTTMAFAAACLAAAAVPAAQATTTHHHATAHRMAATSGVVPSAAQNVRQSRRYDRMLETNRGYRQARMRKECGPIADPQLHQQCIASFNQAEPVQVGSSTAPRHHRYHSSAGR
jgi:hypothetical protein